MVFKFRLAWLCRGVNLGALPRLELVVSMVVVLLVMWRVGAGGVGVGGPGGSASRAPLRGVWTPLLWDQGVLGDVWGGIWL